MSATTPDTTTFRAKAAANLDLGFPYSAMPIPVAPAALLALCDGYDDAQRSHHSMHGLPGHPCHELYSRCFRDDADLREYRVRQREHGARQERERLVKDFRAIRDTYRPGSPVWDFWDTAASIVFMNGISEVDSDV